MIEQRESTFGDTPEGESILLLLETAKQGCYAAIKMMGDFPERFENSVLREEARKVSAKAIQDFSELVNAANEHRLVLRVKQ